MNDDVRRRIGDVVERLVVATRLRYPLVGDLARSIRYEVYERPVIDAARHRLYADVREDLAQLAANPTAADRSERIDALVISAEPVVRLMAEQLTDPTGPGCGGDARGDEPALLQDPRRWRTCSSRPSAGDRG